VASGNELAVAYVAGAAALVRAYYPALSADEVTDRLLNGADHRRQRCRTNSSATAW
jgi:membrane-anchored mycosin MYCP